jgi:tetratricopeptide (TPR) repeat protein
MTKRKRRKSRRRKSHTPSIYKQKIRRADETLTENGVELQDDNWQALVLEWCTPEGPERSMMARYIAEHENELGVDWAREILRMEVYFQVQDYEQIIAHHERAFPRYPRCALVEMWVADQVFRHAGDFWRARPMYHYAIAHLPEHPKPYYEMGYMSYLLGDFDGALSWFDQATERVSDVHGEIAARVFYNRGIVRYFLGGDKETVVADMKEALRYKRGYVQARQVLRSLRGRREVRFVPW